MGVTRRTAIGSSPLGIHSTWELFSAVCTYQFVGSSGVGAPQSLAATVEIQGTDACTLAIVVPAA